MAVFGSLLATLRDCGRSRAILQLEILACRHQLQVLDRSHARRLQLTRFDRMLWVSISRLWGQWRSALVMVKPETVISWHRRGFRLYWSWKSRHRTGRPQVGMLIRTISTANPLWGSPRIHGELLRLVARPRGVTVSQAIVAKYIVRHERPPSQTWRMFLANHVHQLVAADCFVVPTATCRLLFVLVLLAHDRRRIVHIAVTDHPTAAWTAQQLREAFPWDDAPKYLLRDRDHAFSAVKGIGVQEIVTAARSPWQNAYVERFIGSVRRECLDHVILLTAAVYAAC